MEWKSLTIFLVIFYFSQHVMSERDIKEVQNAKIDLRQADMEKTKIISVNVQKKILTKTNSNGLDVDTKTSMNYDRKDAFQNILNKLQLSGKKNISFLTEKDYDVIEKMITESEFVSTEEFKNYIGSSAIHFKRIKELEDIAKQYLKEVEMSSEREARYRKISVYEEGKYKMFNVKATDYLRRSKTLEASPEESWKKYSEYRAKAESKRGEIEGYSSWNAALKEKLIEFEEKIRQLKTKLHDVKEKNKEYKTKAKRLENEVEKAKEHYFDEIRLYIDHFSKYNDAVRKSKEYSVNSSIEIKECEKCEHLVKEHKNFAKLMSTQAELFLLENDSLLLKNLRTSKRSGQTKLEMELREFRDILHNFQCI
ncbi:1-phosphatidylinositol 4,5-bisphosphate phosphodiesterase beta-1-like isoform X3 [Periplaneta americana]|uniref:1-phosphatidylinositol 4,5-bisphosphate phosphodiesterase beta-1-like isoform X3 n=1 Tax=Periplaneta americana TaxID=6978 RepID=UPI0037E7A4FA